MFPADYDMVRALMAERERDASRTASRPRSAASRRSPAAPMVRRLARVFGRGTG